MAPSRLTSWVFHVGTAGTPGGDLCPSSPSQQAPRTCCVSPEPRSFTALCGGVDSRGCAAAGDEGPVGGEGSIHGDPLIERLILEFGDKRRGWGEVPHWVGRGGESGRLSSPQPINSICVRNQECGQISLQLLSLTGEWSERLKNHHPQPTLHHPP